VGGGIMGLNIAYQLRRRDANMSISVLERAPTLGHGSSGYSTGFQRAYYSFDETMAFALDGMAAYKDWQAYLKDEQAEAYFTETGALWMLGYDAAQNAQMQARLAQFGVGSDLIDERELAHRFPQMSPEPFPTFDNEGNELPSAHGAFSAVYEHGCGHLDSSTCLTDLLRACARDGIDVRFNTRVEAFETSADGARCTGVRLDDGSFVGAGTVVNASGPWFNKLNATVGVELSTSALPTRIQVGHKSIGDEFCNLPFVADGWGPSGIYFMPRAANNQLVFGSVAHRFESEIVDPDAYNASLDPDVKQDYLNCLFHRLPNLPRDGEIIGFSSMYTVNQDDVHPMIGETAVNGLWACNGFSGHGFKLAPAVGSLVAQQITGLKTDAWETSIDHDFMGPYREPLTLKVKTHFA
jgi:glycine/D-amino acid oxidase-like deaminating enzyme